MTGHNRAHVRVRAPREADVRDSLREQTASGYATFNNLDLSRLHGCFDGVIQHSFALQLPHAHEFRETSGWLPRRGRQAKSSASFSAQQHRYQRQASKRLLTVFEDRTGAFAFKYPSEFLDAEDARNGGHDVGGYSWLVRNRHTCLDPQPLALLHSKGENRLPAPLGWAEEEIGDDALAAQGPTWDGFIFAQRGRATWTGDHARPITNDLLLEDHESDAHATPRLVSHVLFQLWAHWRSRLFGVSLANRFFNVFLPYAILTPDPREQAPPEAIEGAVAAGPCSEGSWLMQPFVSLVREPDRSHCRRTFTFTVLLVPMGDSLQDAGPSGRQMSLREIEASIRGAWGLAAQRVGHNRRKFSLEGPLRRYCSNVEHSLPDGELTTRQWIEAAIYSTTLLRRDRLQPWWRIRRVPNDQELGDKVLTSLASSRVSAVTVVDRRLRPEEVRVWHESGSSVAGSGAGAPDEALLPGALPALVRAVSGRTYLAPVGAYRVDRPFLDKDSYVECAVPAVRSLITTTTPGSQHRYESSGLVQSVFSGYMALGAATAQSLIRSSYHEIEAHTDPKQFGEISKEFTRDFHEIYDLDIVWESYKRTYRAILEQFEIMKDYEALRHKVDMLFDSTVAEFTEWQHTRLWFVTWLLVFVAVATVVVTVTHH